MVSLLSEPCLQGLRSKGVVPVLKAASFAAQTTPAQQRKQKKYNCEIQTSVTYMYVKKLKVIDNAVLF
jgi:hypothetical protein